MGLGKPVLPQQDGEQGGEPRRGESHLLITLSALLILSNAQAIGIETIDYDNASYYWVNGTGTIGPHILINATSGDAQIATCPTYNFASCYARMGMKTDTLGFYRWNAGLGRFVGQGSNDLSELSTYAFTDNATYWRTEANGTRNVGGRNLGITLNHRQDGQEEYYNETFSVKFPTPLNITFDLWVAKGLTDFHRLDTISWANNSYSSGMAINDSYTRFEYMDNVSSITVVDMDSGVGWYYIIPQTQYGSRLAIYNGSAYIGFNLGRSLSNSIGYTLFAIDANPCVSTCGAGDGVVIDFTGAVPDPGGNVPINATYGTRWHDSLGTCTIAFCSIMLRTTTFYNQTKGATQTINGSRTIPPGSNWYTCNMEDSANNCIGSSPYFAYYNNPTKNTWYYWNATMVGRYFGLSFTHIVYSGLGGSNGGDLVAGQFLTDNPAGIDTIKPNFTIENIINNTANCFPAYNSTHVNVTLQIRCKDNGLCNASTIAINVTGSLVNQTPLDLIDYWNVTGAYSYLVPTGSAQLVAVGGNDTNRNVGYQNRTIFFACELISSTSNPTPIPRKPFWYREEMVYGVDQANWTSYDYGALGLFLLGVALLATFALKNRKQPAA